MYDKIIATKEEISNLFETEEKQEIFKKIIIRIIDEMTKRTIEVPFVQLHSKEIE